MSALFVVSKKRCKNKCAITSINKRCKMDNFNKCKQTFSETKSVMLMISTFDIFNGN